MASKCSACDTSSKTQRSESKEKVFIQHEGGKSVNDIAHNVDKSHPYSTGTLQYPI